MSYPGDPRWQQPPQYPPQAYPPQYQQPYPGQWQQPQAPRVTVTRAPLSAGIVMGLRGRKVTTSSR